MHRREGRTNQLHATSGQAVRSCLSVLCELPRVEVDLASNAGVHPMRTRAGSGRLDAMASGWGRSRFGAGLASFILGLALWCFPAGAASRWTAHRAPDPTPSKDTSLAAVSCTSTRACTAVGGSGRGPLVERWKGGRWSIQATARFAGLRKAGLEGVSCTRGAGCVAVGFSRRWPLVERSDDSGWSVQPTPRSARLRGGNLTAVSCEENRFCIAVGTVSTSVSSRPLAERWDGESWSLQQLTKGLGDASLNGVSCTSRGACTAVGSYTRGFCSAPLIERWNGKRWSIQRIRSDCSTDTRLSGVSCASSTRCIAVGGVYETGGPGAYGGLWDGKAWSEHDPPDFVNGVSCRSDSCTAVGDRGQVERLNGAHWSSVRTSFRKGLRPDLSGVSCPSATSCFAVGSGGNLRESPVVAHGP